MDAKKFNQTLDEIRNGNISILAEIYNAYYNFMFNTAIAIVNNSIDADDVVSNFLKYLLEKIQAIGYIEHPKAWIATSIRNDAVRSAKQAANTLYLSENAEDPLVHPSKFDLVILLNDSLKLLTDTEQEIFDMHYLIGLKYREISKELNRPVGTIKRDVHKIKNKLKHLKKEL